MKTVNLGDPYTRKLTLRLSEIQYKHLIRMSEEFETSPSNYIRYLIDKSLSAYDREYIEQIMGGTSNENVKANSNDLL